MNTDTGAETSAETSDEPRYRDPEWLRERYVEEQRSTPDIAEECECAISTVRSWLDRHGIETRSQSEAQIASSDPRLRDEEWLHQEYVVEQRTTVDIAEERECSDKTVRSWLDRHGIGTRSRLEASRLDSDPRLRDEQWLREQYVSERRSTSDIADERDCDPETVRSWLNRHGIETRGGPRRMDVVWVGGDDT